MYLICWRKWISWNLFVAAQQLRSKKWGEKERLETLIMYLGGVERRKGGRLRERERERTEAWLRESPRHETTLFCFDRSSQPRPPRREEEEKKRKWNEEGEKERNKARVKWSKKLTHKVEMQCGDKEKDGRLRKKERKNGCVWLR